MHQNAETAANLKKVIVTERLNLGSTHFYFTCVDTSLAYESDLFFTFKDEEEPKWAVIFKKMSKIIILSNTIYLLVLIELSAGPVLTFRAAGLKQKTKVILHIILSSHSRQI